MAQLVLPLETRPALGREDFIVADANREAVAMIDDYPAWPASAVALHGPSGSGKSHLVAVWAGRAKAHIVEASALDDDVLRHEAVAVENADRAAPDLARDRVLFALFERGGPLLFTAQTWPDKWCATLPDLASRYRGLLAFALGVPDDDLLGALARKLFADRQLRVPDAVIAQMLRALERSPAAIRDFVARLDRMALAERRPITASLVRDALGD